MTDKNFVFAADRHGREDDAEGDIYIGAGDEIYAVDNREDAESIEEHQTGFYGNAESQEEVAEYAAGELDQRFEQLSEEYEEAYLALGNHEDQLLNKQLVKQVAQKYDNVHIKEDELVEIEGQNFYFDKSFQTNDDKIKQVYNNEVNASDAGYEQEELEQAGEILDKEPSDLNCQDITSILEGEVEQEKTSKIRETLESTPILGKYLFQPLYNMRDKYLGKRTETVEFEGLEKTEMHQEIQEIRSSYEETINETVEEIESVDGEVTYVAHGSPQTEDKPSASIRTREILERSENIGTAYTGHFHSGFNGEEETEIGGTKVINPMEGYTVDNSGGALENYETHQFEGDPVAEAEPIELQGAPQQQGARLSEEEQQKARQIAQEVQQEASSEQEMHRMMQERLMDEGISI